jgi:glycosyltransferase involved in cell wall biosynthesis
MNAMKVLQVCPDPYGLSGGILVHVQNISERLAKKHDVTVYATNHGLRYPRYELRNGVKIERFDCIAPNEAYYLSWEMLLRLRKARFDIVHAHGYHAFPLHFSTLAKCDKFIVTPHFHGVGHSTFRNSLVRLLKPFGKRSFEKADRIIAVSEYEKSLIREQFGFGVDRVTVIPNGVSFNEFSGLKKRDRGFRSVLYVGYLIGFKGSQYLVEVLPKLPADVVLEIVGHGPLKPYLERRAKELGVSDRVRFYEYLSREELLQKFADADVFAMLSAYEAYSIVVAEALAAGTPCVVAKTSALSEWVDNETCIGVDFPISLAALARQINRVLDNDVDLKAIRKWMGTKILDWNEITNRLEHLYVNYI